MAPYGSKMRTRARLLLRGLFEGLQPTGKRDGASPFLGDDSSYAITATLARLPRRTTMRAGSAGSGTRTLSASSPSSFTAFSAILRLASAPPSDRQLAR